MARSSLKLLNLSNEPHTIMNEALGLVLSIFLIGFKVYRSLNMISRQMSCVPGGNMQDG